MRRIVFFPILLIIIFTSELHAEELHFFAGAGLRQPVDELIDNYQGKTGNRVFVDYDGSGRLLARITASGQGDLFMPGSFFYIEKLQTQGKIHNWKPVVAHTPVIAVNKSNTQNITCFKDLAKEGVRLALGDPKAMAFGKTAMEILDRSGMKESILANVIVYGATVKQLALYVTQGDVDASIIGRTDAFQFRDQLNMLLIPDDYFESETVAAAVLNSTSNLKEAMDLQSFLTSPKAVKVFEDFGFLPLEK